MSPSSFTSCKHTEEDHPEDSCSGEKSSMGFSFHLYADKFVSFKIVQTNYLILRRFSTNFPIKQYKILIARALIKITSYF